MTHKQQQQDEADIPVVTIDSEVAVDAVPVEASPLTGGRTTTSSAPPPPLTEADYDEGCDCILLCGDTRVRRLHRGFSPFCSLCGNTYIDVRNSRFAPGSHYSVFILKLCGDARVTVPRGTRVRVRRLLLCGSRDVHVEDAEVAVAAGPPPPRLTITIVSLCGDARVRSEGLEDD
jgi:hypothetical protein